MKIRSRLKHAAAGLLQSFVSRNNDLYGYWALGLLYRDAGAPPHAMRLDLLGGVADPDSEASRVIVARYQIFLRAALAKHQIAWEDIREASLTLQFAAPVSLPCYPSWIGDPLVCTLALRNAFASAVEASAVTQCAVWRPGRFSRSIR